MILAFSPSDVNKDLTFEAKDLTAFTVEYFVGLDTFNVIPYCMNAVD